MQPYPPQGPYPPPPGPPTKKSTWVLPVVIIAVACVVVGGAAVLVLNGGDDGGTATADGSGGDGDGGGGSGGAGAAGAATSLTGTWEGTYECVRGTAGLTLTIDDAGDGRIGANFAYHPTDDNPDTPTGRYSMEGSAGDGQLTLEGDRWIDPEDGGNHPMLGIEAERSSRTTPEHLEGTLTDGEGCTTFTVDRVSTDPWYVGTWEGAYGCTQGVTGLRLTIEPGPDDTVTAVYEFQAVPENPDVPSGSFAMEGVYQDRTLTLEGVEWIERPQDYLMVDLEFIPELGIDPLRMYGAVDADGLSGCTVFTLSPVDG
jgi:hypothetical protein